MSIKDKVKAAMDHFRNEIEKAEFGDLDTSISTGDVDLLDTSTPTGDVDLYVTDTGVDLSTTGGYVSGTSAAPGDFFIVTDGTGGSSTWSSAYASSAPEELQLGPWKFTGSSEGHIEVVFETDKERREFHINPKNMMAMLEKLSFVVLEGKIPKDFNEENNPVKAVTFTDASSSIAGVLSSGTTTDRFSCT